MDFGYRQAVNEWNFKHQCKDFLLWRNPGLRVKFAKDSSRSDTPGSRAGIRPISSKRPQTCRPQSNNRSSPELTNDERLDRLRQSSAVNRRARSAASSSSRGMNHPATPRNGREEWVDDGEAEGIIRDSCRSIYQTDYLGIPQGVNMRTAFKGKDPKPSPPHTLDTNSRISYKRPSLPAEPALRPETTRFGSNPHFHISAQGIVPAISSGDVEMGSARDARTPRTTYSREFIARRPFTAPGTRFGQSPHNNLVSRLYPADDFEPEVDPYAVPAIVNKDEIFRRARSARVNESLTYRTPLQPAIVNLCPPPCN